MTIDQVVHILNLAPVMSPGLATRNLGAAFAAV